VYRPLAPLADEGVALGSGFPPQHADFGSALATGRRVRPLVEETREASVDALAEPARWPPPSASDARALRVLVAAGAAAELGRTEVTFPITGFWNGTSFTKRSVQIA
jgi:hypothetical protein